jgi:hypothetical protein
VNNAPREGSGDTADLIRTSPRASGHGDLPHEDGPRSRIRLCADVAHIGARRTIRFFSEGRAMSSRSTKTPLRTGLLAAAMWLAATAAAFC